MVCLNKGTLNGIRGPTTRSVYYVLKDLYCPHTLCGFDFRLSCILQQTIMSFSIVSEQCLSSHVFVPSNG
jgi:hypothetical protein